MTETLGDWMNSLQPATPEELKEDERLEAQALATQAKYFQKIEELVNKYQTVTPENRASILKEMRTEGIGTLVFNDGTEINDDSVHGM
jgi:hypothetical protein